MSADAASLLIRGLELTGELLDALEAEYQALQTDDPAALAEAARRKESLLPELQALPGTLAHTLGLDETASPQHIAEQLAQARDPRLVELHERFTEQLEACRHRNHVNGGMVELARLQVAQALSILRGNVDARGVRTYDDHGRLEETRERNLLSRA